jgi:hypothetical protein
MVGKESQQARDFSAEFPPRWHDWPLRWYDGDIARIPGRAKRGSQQTLFSIVTIVENGLLL